MRRLWRRIRLRILLFLLARISRFSIPELLAATQRGLRVPPDVLIRQRDEQYQKEDSVVELAYQYKVALDGHPVVRDLFARLYRVQRELGEAILQGRHDEWGHDVTDNFRRAFAIVEDIIALPGQLQARKEQIEEFRYGVQPAKVDNPTDEPKF